MTLLYLLLTCLLFPICLASSHNSSSEPMSLSLPYCLIKNHMRSCSFPSLFLSVWWLAGLVPYLDEKAESLKAVEVTDGMWIFILFLFLPTTWNDRGMRSVLFLSYLKVIFFLSFFLHFFRAREMKCTNWEHPDLYGHYREVQFVMTKHHWFWKVSIYSHSSQWIQLSHYVPLPHHDDLWPDLPAVAYTVFQYCYLPS